MRSGLDLISQRGANGASAFHLNEISAREESLNARIVKHVKIASTLEEAPFV
jgi:hypothetical protein